MAGIGLNQEFGQGFAKCVLWESDSVCMCVFIMPSVSI